MKKYVFKPYSRNLPKLFEEEKQRIASQIKNTAIEHVGSTAVPGLGGKGIIDMVVATNIENIKGMFKQLQKLGYEFKPTGGTSDRLFFQIDLPDKEGEITRYHLHLTRHNSKDWESMIKFRDYLRNNPSEAEKYAEIKKKAASQANEDREKYMELKEPAIKYILEKI
ncbi:MAG: GrpB family protein [Patescibacteria group bacterium]